MRKKYGKTGMSDTEFKLRVCFEKEVLSSKIPEIKNILQRAITDENLREELFIIFMLGNCYAIMEDLK